MGKYTCLICQKEFSSESGVKYHISKTHSQVGPQRTHSLTAVFIKLAGGWPLAPVSSSHLAYRVISLRMLLATVDVRS